MRNICTTFTFILLATLATEAQSCLGVWKVIEDKTNDPACILELFEKEGKVYGKLLKILKKDTKQINPMCVECSDDRKDQPVIGMELIRGLKKKGKFWSGGKLLDPDSGRTYKCYVEMVNADKLKVRGYIGFSIIGRTQYWYREKEIGD